MSSAAVSAKDTPMEIAQKIYEDDEDADKWACSICFYVRSPTILIPCGHTICKKCATELTNGKSENKKCPECRAPFSAFVPNFALSKFLPPDEPEYNFTTMARLIKDVRTDSNGLAARYLSERLDEILKIQVPFGPPRPVASPYRASTIIERFERQLDQDFLYSTLPHMNPARTFYHFTKNMQAVSDDAVIDLMTTFMYDCESSYKTARLPFMFASTIQVESALKFRELRGVRAGTLWASILIDQTNLHRVKDGCDGCFFACWEKELIPLICSCRDVVDFLAILASDALMDARNDPTQSATCCSIVKSLLAGNKKHATEAKEKRGKKRAADGESAQSVTKK